jgi:hypothetical protein
MGSLYRFEIRIKLGRTAYARLKSMGRASAFAPTLISMIEGQDHPECCDDGYGKQCELEEQQ